MNTAIVKFDTLADTIGPAAKNHNLAFIADLNFIRSIISGEVVGGIFDAAYRDGLTGLNHIKGDTSFPDFFFGSIEEFGKILVCESVFFGLD